MANELALCAAPGLVLTASLLQGTTQVASGLPMNESAVPGYYTGNVPGGTAAGLYTVLFINAGSIKAAGQLRWDGAAEVLPGTVAQGAQTLQDLADLADLVVATGGGGGSSGDPLAAAVPGAYADGTAGAALGKLNAAAPLGPATVVPGVPAEVGLCRVYAYLETVDNLPAANVEIEFVLMSPGTTASERLIAGRTVTARTDAQGRLTGNGTDPFVELQRNDLLLPAGTTYLVRCPELGVAGKTVTLAGGTADLRALLLAA